MTSPKRPGRPTKHSTAMTPRQRAAEYRARRREAAGAVTEDLNAASTRALLDGLARRLATLETPATTSEIADGARWAAGKIIRKLCERYKIDF